MSFTKLIWLKATNLIHGSNQQSAHFGGILVAKSQNLLNKKCFALSYLGDNDLSASLKGGIFQKNFGLELGQ